MKVLVDPAVAKDKTLRQNISHKRNEALARCNEMKEKLGQGQRYSHVGVNMEPLELEVPVYKVQT